MPRLSNAHIQPNKVASMLRTVLFTASMMMCGFSIGQALTLADAKAKNAVQLSASELRKLLPGATIVNQGPAGATRRWENNPSGNLAASTDGRGNTGGHAYPGSGSGSWKIDDKGMYCVAIKWPRVTEDWCRYVFKTGDRYYAFDTLDDTARGSEFEISK